MTLLRRTDRHPRGWILGHPGDRCDHCGHGRGTGRRGEIALDGGYRYPPEYSRTNRHFTHPVYSDDYYRRGRRRTAAERDPDTLWAAPANRRRREPRGPWTGAWYPDEWPDEFDRDPPVDYDWAYGARRPDR